MSGVPRARRIAAADVVGVDSIASDPDAAARPVPVPEELDPRIPSEPATGILFVMSGPSGVGKDTITKALRELGEEGLPLGFCVTATTRPPRPGEIDGLHYHFLTHPQFAYLKRLGGFLEDAWVHQQGDRYGIPRRAMRKGLRKGYDVWVTPDVKGHDTLRRELPGLVSIFLMPPDIDSLIVRLAHRHRVDPDLLRARFHDPAYTDDLVERLRNAEREMARADEFDYIVTNEDGSAGLARAVEEVRQIILAERARVPRRTVTV
ncbi:MAG: guanylate kinase [Chloroflexota bacterium]|nr:guanylate kinase [Chloroflexota bacterium]